MKSLFRGLLIFVLGLAAKGAGANETLSKCERFMTRMASDGVAVVTLAKPSKSDVFPAAAVIQDFNRDTDLIIGLTEQRHGYLIAPGLPRFDAGFMTRSEFRLANGEPHVNRGLFFHLVVDPVVAQDIRREVQAILGERNLTCIQAMGRILSGAGFKDFSGSMTTPGELIQAVEQLRERMAIQPYLFLSESKSYVDFVENSSLRIGLRGDGWLGSYFRGRTNRRDNRYSSDRSCDGSTSPSDSCWTSTPTGGRSAARAGDDSSPNGSSDSPSDSPGGCCD